MGMYFSIQEIMTAFVVLFAVIDITGAIPVIIDLNSSGRKVNAAKASLLSLIILVVFLFAGNALLRLFNTDIASFAMAGALVLFALAVEMTLDIEIFRHNGPEGYTTLVPVVFPLVAGPGTLTTALTLRAECSVENIIIAVLINMVIVYIVLSKVNFMERLIGKGGIYIIRKFFGIILLAMAVRLFVSNLRILLDS